MIEKSDIEKNLQKIDQLFTGSSSIQEGLLYSKLAILELCGWIETSMDNIVLDMAHRVILDPKHLRHFNITVRKVYGFEYEKHFRHMIITLVGLHGVEAMEKNVDLRAFLPMRAALNDLKPYRDKQAHGYIQGTTLHLDAPSITLGRFHTVHAGLVDIDGVLKSML